MWFEATVNFEYDYWHVTEPTWKAITWLSLRPGSQYISVKASQVTCNPTVVQ